MSDPNVLLAHAIAQRDTVTAQLAASLEAGQHEGRTRMTVSEEHISKERDRLNAEIADLQAEVSHRSHIHANLSRQFGDPSTRNTEMSYDPNLANLTYRKGDSSV